MNYLKGTIDSFFPPSSSENSLITEASVGKMRVRRLWKGWVGKKIIRGELSSSEGLVWGWDITDTVDQPSQSEQKSGGNLRQIQLPSDIPDICHFFTLAKFLENKIYTENANFLR